MSEISPYTSPQAQQQPQAPLPPQQVRSSVPKVFGILHIIYAALGIIAGLSTFVSSAALKGLQASAGGNDAELQKMMDAIDSVLTYSYIDAAVRIGLGILLLMAGIKLLKYQAAGVKLSNLWTIIRVIWLVLFTAISYSATKAMQEALLGANPEAASVMKAANSVGLILGILLVAAYPVISYLMLNKPNVKKDLV